ncbi:tetratricopeptide repeat protein [Bartonella sp. CB189]|uniref:tetratricopeptide repeat protein n=1 Tax=Bartonella sp. CB189 TaxID=3112254 RepID=UPI002F96161E
MLLLVLFTTSLLLFVIIFIYSLHLNWIPKKDKLGSSIGIFKNYMHRKNNHVLKIFSVLFVILMTCNIYSVTGSPETKSYFFNELMNKDPQVLNKRERLARLQVLFFRTPSDGKLADALAVGYLEEGYFQDAVNIYLDALRLNGETAPRLVGYGLALVGYEGGTITQEAQNAFQKAADLSPSDFYSRLLLADALRQSGKSAQAIQFLQNFLNKMPEDFDGRSRVETMIIQLYDSFN